MRTAEKGEAKGEHHLESIGEEKRRKPKKPANATRAGRSSMFTEERKLSLDSPKIGEILLEFFRFSFLPPSYPLSCPLFSSFRLSTCWRNCQLENSRIKILPFFLSSPLCLLLCPLAGDSRGFLLFLFLGPENPTRLLVLLSPATGSPAPASLPLLSIRLSLVWVANGGLSSHTS